MSHLSKSTAKIKQQLPVYVINVHEHFAVDYSQFADRGVVLLRPLYASLRHIVWYLWFCACDDGRCHLLRGGKRTLAPISKSQRRIFRTMCSHLLSSAARKSLHSAEPC